MGVNHGRPFFIVKKMNPLLSFLSRLSLLAQPAQPNLPVQPDPSSLPAVAMSDEATASAPLSAWPPAFSLKQVLESVFASGLDHALIPALNHVLADEAWATETLQAHAGKVACIDVDLFSVSIAITSHGMLELAPESSPVTTTPR